VKFKFGLNSLRPANQLIQYDFLFDFQFIPFFFGDLLIIFDGVERILFGQFQIYGDNDQVNLNAAILWCLGEASFGVTF
jgi:hypothetical protein